MSIFVYILRCKDNSYYTGITWNLDKRIHEHNNRVKSPLQNSKVPVELAYWERFPDRILAAKKEKLIKSGKIVYTERS